MNILHVNTHMNIGGIGQYIASLSSTLRSIGAGCVVASSGGELEEELNNNGIRHLYVPLKTKFEFSPSVFRSVSKLINIIREERIDIVHAHSRVSQVASLLAARKTKIHYVSTCHGFFKTRFSRKIFDTWGEKIVAISEPVRVHLERDFGVDRARIELIYNGIDAARFDKQYSNEEVLNIKRSIGLRDGPVIGTMGRLSPVKGQRFLIEAMKYIVQNNSKAQCLIVGGGPEERALRELANSFGLENKIKFTGASYKDVPAYLSCMDVFVLPSIKEGLGIALLEAMASGKPCIASDIGGIIDIIKDRKNGLLVPVANAGALSGAVIKLLSDVDFGADLAKNGKEHVKEKFSLQLMAKKMLDMYAFLMTGKKGY